MKQQLNYINPLRFFVHPIPLSAVGLMALNDHWLKYTYPGFLTGKISDFCGVFYFPIFLLGLAVGIQIVLSRNQTKPSLLSRKNLFAAILFTDFLMLTVKLSSEAAQAIEQVFGNYLFEIHIVSDRMDLLALMMNPLTYLYMKKYLKK